MLERWLKPRTEHPDPAVRGEALLQLESDDPIFLEALRFDDDAGVRTRLLTKCTDLALLLARASDDEEAGPAARERLQALLGASAEIDARTRHDFVAALEDAPLLAHVATTCPDLATRREALARHAQTGGDHEALLVQVAGTDEDPTLRREALAQLDGVAVLEEVAALTRKSDKHLYKEVRDRIRALRTAAEHAAEGERLAAEIAALAEQDVAANGEPMHLAVALLQKWHESWDPLVAAADAPLPDVGEPLARAEQRIERAREIIARRAALLEDLEQRGFDEAGEPDWRAQWDALRDHTSAQSAQFEKALAARERRAADHRERRGALNETQRFLDEQEARDEVSARRLAQLEKMWAGMTVPGDEQGVALVQRYEALHERLSRAVEAAREAQGKAALAAEPLLAKLEAALEAGQLGPATSAHDKLNHQLGQKGLLAPDVAERLNKGLAKLAPKLRELKEARGWSTRQARESLTRDAEALATAAGGLQAAEISRRVKALRAQWQELDKGVGPAPQEVWTAFDSACKAAYAPAKELFDAGAAQRRELCDALDRAYREHDWEAPDWAALVKLVRETRKAWREAGQVEHRKFQKLRKRFDAAIKPLEAKLDEERERDARRRKLAIGALERCIEREPLEAQIELAKQVQRDWRPTVRGRRKEEQVLWDTLRKHCDDIFARRDAKFSDRRAAEEGAMAAKTEVCNRIDDLLGESGDEPDEAVVNQAKGQFRTLREAWRDAGDVGPKKKGAAQKRYRAACERFEARLRKLERAGTERTNQALIERLELLDRCREARAAGDDDADLAEKWNGLPPVRGALGKKLDAAFAAPVDAGDGAALDGRQALCLRAELAADVPSPAEFASARMAMKIAQLESALTGGGGRGPGQALAEFVEQWLALAPVGEAHAAPLRERFVIALRALAAR